MRFVTVSVLLFLAAHGIEAQGSIAGFVTTNRSAPLHGVLVYLYSIEGSQSGHAFTDSSGMYTFTGLSLGCYKVKVSATALTAFEYYNGQLTIATANVITVSNATTTIANMAPTHLNDSLFAVLSGTVRDMKNGALLYGIHVHVYALSLATGTTTRSATAWSLTHSAKTDALGFWRILGIKADPSTYKWKVQFYDPNNVYLSEWWEPSTTGSHKHSILVATPLTSFSKQPAPTVLDISLINTRDAAVLSGTVTDRVSGLPLKGVSVCLRDSDSLATVIISTITGNNGQYTLYYFGGSPYAMSFSLSNYRTLWKSHNRGSSVDLIVLSSSVPTVANAALITTICSNGKMDGYERIFMSFFFFFLFKGVFFK